MSITLLRYAHHDDYTLGRLDIDGAILQTIERPWSNNEPYVSCIPVGVYTVRRRYSKKHGNHWHVLDVPDRTFILFHAANWVFQLHGCIAPGMQTRWDTNKNMHMVTSSRIAMHTLDKKFHVVDEFELLIDNFSPGYL